MGLVFLIGLAAITVAGIAWTLRNAGHRALAGSIASVAFGLFVIRLGIDGVISDRWAVGGALFVFGPIYVLPVMAWWRRHTRS